MNPILKNVLAVIAGIIIGSVVNMAIVMLGGSIIPPPEGVNVMDPESIKANLHLYQSKHFIMPLIAHALGTLVGAFVAYKLAASHHNKIAYGIGVWFLIGGIYAVSMFSGPLWFKILDLGGAYIPMAWLGIKLASGKSE